MKKLMTVALLACGLVACGGGTTVTGPETVSQPETTTAAAPVAQPQTVAPPAGKPHVGTIDGAAFSIQNNSGTAAQYAARIYEVLAGGEQQLRQEFISGSVPAGQSWGGAFASLPCNYQIDLDQYFVVKNPPAPGEIAAKIVTGNVCPRPEPTPTPEPSPEPTPTPSPSPTPTPQPTCEQLNPTSYYTDQTQNFNFDTHGSDRGELNSANVHVKVWNKDNWKLEIWASNDYSRVNSLSERQTVTEDTTGDSQVRIKGSDSDTPSCGKHKELIVNISQHTWKYWFFRIYRNGSIVFTSDLIYLP